MNIPQGKQLISQSVYLFGTMLLLIDRIMPGNVRQKLLISYYRYVGQVKLHKINAIRKLCKCTGYLQEFASKKKHVENYPEDYFARFPIDQKLIDYIITNIKDDDIYQQKYCYPEPQHASFAYSNQGSILFVILFFSPNILIKQKSKMREIVDKHFYNCWVISFYLGYTVDLTYFWQPYKAAKTALGNILDYQMIEDLLKYFTQLTSDNTIKIKEYLNAGVIDQQYVLLHINKLMNCLREANIAVKWLMLHCNTSHQKIHKIINDKINKGDILVLFLVCSQFENKIKENIQLIHSKKEEMWKSDQEQCLQKIRQLAQYFSSEKTLGKKSANESFKQWFQQMIKQIQALQYTQSTYIGRKVLQLIQALQDIQEYQQIGSNLQIRQYLSQTRKELKHIVKLANFKLSFAYQIAILSDITWSWESIKNYIQLMQVQISQNPQNSLLLKNMFIKLSSILNVPMVRIVQSNSQDITSVSKYYSNQLIRFVKKVLQVIPSTVFQILEEMINQLTHNLKLIPHKLNKLQLKDYNQFQLRKKLAAMTTKITVFTKSVFSMETYLVGVIQVKPKQILQDGLRRELIKLISKILKKQLIFKQHTPEQFMLKLNSLRRKIQGLKNALQYIQDFILSFGLKVYFQQFQRLIDCYIDIQTKVIIFKQLVYQELNYDQDIPMPGNQLRKQGSLTFIGVLMKELLNLTSASRCIYFDNVFAFYEASSKKEVFSLRFIGMLYKCMGISGLSGLNKLYAVCIQENIKNLKSYLQKTLDESMKRLFYQNMKDLYKKEKIEKVIMKKGLINDITSELQKIGQFSLLRKMICVQLQMVGKVGNPRLFITLENLNESIIQDILKRNQQNVEIQQPDRNDFFFTLSQLMSHFGFTDPIKKIYEITQTSEFLPLVLFYVFCSNFENFIYDSKIKKIMKKNKSEIEPSYLMIGMCVLLNQYHQFYKQLFYQYIVLFIKEQISSLKNKLVDKEALNYILQLIQFLQQITKLGEEKLPNLIGNLLYLTREK